MYLVNDSQTYQQKVKANKHYPLLIEKYISGREYDFDAVFDGQNLYHVGPVEHIEASGVHSGDASLLIKSSFSKKTQSQMKKLLTVLRKDAYTWFSKYADDCERYKMLCYQVNPRISRTYLF